MASMMSPTERYFRILLVEDNPGDARLIREMLRDAQHFEFALTLASRLSEARDHLAAAPFDIVLLDLVLPDSQGLQTLSAIQRHAPDATAIVVLTGLTDDTTGLEAVRQGAQDYLIKGQTDEHLLVRAITYAVERTQLEDDLRTSESKFRSVVEQSQDGILLLDNDGRIVEWNRSQEQITGLVRDEVSGQFVWDIYFRLLPPEDIAEDTYQRLKALVLGVLHTGEITAENRLSEITIMRPDGQRRVVQISLFPVTTEDKQVFGVILRDITVNKQAEQALQDSHRFLQATLDSLSAHIAILDHTGTIIAVNRAWRRFADQNGLRDPSYAVGTNFLTLCEAVIGPEAADAQAVASGIRHVLHGHREDFHYEYPCHSPDGEQRWFSLRLNHFQIDQTDHVVTAHYDITERVQAEIAEREQRQLAEALRDTAASLTSTLNLTSVLNNILDNVDRVVPHDASTILLSDGDEAYVAHSQGHTAEFQKVSRDIRYRVSETFNLHQMLRTKTPVVVADTSIDPHWVRTPDIAWIQSSVAAPIMHHGQVIGFLTLDSHTRGFFTHRHAEQLLSFANQAAVAIENARLYEQVQQHSAHLEQRVAERTADLTVRNAVAETLSSSLTILDILPAVLQTIAEQLNVMGGAIHFEEGEPPVLQLAARYNLPQEALVLLTTPVLSGSSPDLLTIHDQTLLPPAIREAGIHAMLRVPVMRQGQVDGLITLVHDRQHQWTELEIRMVYAIGQQIGVALSNARLYAAALNQEAQIRTILNSVADGLVVFDSHVQLLLNNPSAQALFSFYPAEWGGAQRAAEQLWGWLQTRFDPQNYESHTVEFFLPSTPITVIELGQYARSCPAPDCAARVNFGSTWAWWLYLNADEPARYMRCSLFRRVPKCTVQANIAPVRHDDGRILGHVVVLRDVTHYRELDQLKDRFVSTVTHELRTPAASLILAIETLTQYYDRLTPEKRIERIRKLQEQGYVLHDLINDILDLSRFDAHLSLPEKQTFDLAEQCRVVLQSFEEISQKKRLKIGALGLDIPTPIVADPDQIARVVRNLIGNAVKYTSEEGHIFVQVTRMNSDVQVSVRDTGIGIPAEDQAHIFERFYRI